MPNSKKGSESSRKRPTSDELMDKLKGFIRTRGAELLRDPNITSVGIGYKQKEGKSTGELAIQFTVAQKVVPELLETVTDTPIPPSFEVDGVTVPTDVLERTYEPSFRVVAERQPSPRKTRIDPVIPGVSVGHTSVSAGTIGCIVFDQHSGTPYLLSNWHVLQGSQGSIGDDVVQPGRHDDNRVDRNRVGKLVRSHLGAAGDCAVASIEGRAFRPEIIDLDVSVEQLGEPELDDKVIKSGRTTGVTHGIVTRVHTIASLNYGGNVGIQAIGAFEIGPDPDKPAENNEISMGGDSGSVWLFRDGGRTTRIMAGLHFAGEASTDPTEHALACYPRSVFEKLEISLEPPALPAPGAEAELRRGYNTEFLRHQVPLPILTAAGKRSAFKRDRTEVIPYTHFSLALNGERRFAMWVAWNIDGGQLKKVSRRGIPFKLDPDIPSEFQVGNFLYAGNRLDRGHIARRADLCWGSETEARQANRDSFFFTNITPQMDDFNQSSREGIWGRLEDAVFAEVDVEDLRVSVIAGPVFRNDDREFRGVKLPREFFKVLAYVENGELKVKAFLLTQSLNELEALDLAPFRVFEATLAEVEQRCEFLFADELKPRDRFAEALAARPEAAEERRPLERLEDIHW